MRGAIVNRKIGMLLALVLALLPFSSALAQSQDPSPYELLANVRFDQNLNAQIPQGLAFMDDTGSGVELGSYFGGKPVLLMLAYYNCPNLCSLALNGLLNSLKNVALTAGKDFQIVVVSIDPSEKPPLAAEKKAQFLEIYNRPGAEQGWHFLTGQQLAIQRLAQVVGFHYGYDKVQKEYAHPTGVMVLTPQGKLSRYLYGIDYAPIDLRLGLVEASSGQIGSPVDQLVLACYHYDPVTGKYTPAITRILQIVSAALVVIMAVVLFIAFRREQGQNLRTGT